MVDYEKPHVQYLPVTTVFHLKIFSWKSDQEQRQQHGQWAQTTMMKSFSFRNCIYLLLRYYTTSTEMTVHRIAFCELSSNEFLGGYNFIEFFSEIRNNPHSWPFPLKWLLKASPSFFLSHTLLHPWLGLAWRVSNSVWRWLFWPICFWFQWPSVAIWQKQKWL